MAADMEIMLFKSELPALFARVDQDSGFAAITLSMHYAIQSLKGKALNEAQIDALQSCVAAIENSPFISFDDSLPIIDSLTSVGLEIDPPEAQDLSDLLAE